MKFVAPYTMYLSNSSYVVCISQRKCYLLHRRKSFKWWCDNLWIIEQHFWITLYTFSLSKKKTFQSIWTFFSCVYAIRILCMYVQCTWSLHTWLGWYKIHIWSFAKNSVNCLTFRMRGKQVKINYKSILLKLEKHWLEERIFSDEITNYGENMQFFKQ